MLRWALGFLILAIVAAFLGFGGVAHASMEISKVLAYVFLALFLIALIWTLVTGRRRRAG